MFDPDYTPDQKADPSGLGLTKDTIIRPIGEYSVTDPVKRETEIKAEPLETVGDILTDHSLQCQLRIQISNIISIQGSTRTPTPTDEYSMDSTIQGGIVTPPAHPLDSMSSSSHQADAQVNYEEINNSSKDITAPIKYSAGCNTSRP